MTVDDVKNLKINKFSDFSIVGQVILINQLKMFTRLNGKIDFHKYFLIQIIYQLCQLNQECKIKRKIIPNLN